MAEWASRTLPELSAEMNAKLEEWVSAKRQRDFQTSDRIRDEMKRDGVNPEDYRPPPGKGGGGGGYGAGGGYGGPGTTRDFYIDVHMLELDTWTWNRIANVRGPSPRPRSDHCAAATQVAPRGRAPGFIVDLRVGRGFGQ